MSGTHIYVVKKDGKIFEVHSDFFLAIRTIERVRMTRILPAELVKISSILCYNTGAEWIDQTNGRFSIVTRYYEEFSCT